MIKIAQERGNNGKKSKRGSNFLFDVKGVKEII